MFKIGLFVLLTVLVSTSYGVMLNKKIKYKLNDFVTPIGFALLMMLLQICYYPAMLFNWSSNYEHIMTLIVFAVGVIYALKNYKDILDEYLHKRTLIIGLAFIVFVVVFYQCYIDITFSDSQMYLNYMSQNINTDHVNMFNLWTGEYGKEWDTIYLFQGYYHFGSSMCYLINSPYYLFGVGGLVENITIQTWGLGMLYSIMSSMLIYNFTDYFKTNKWVKYIILAFGLFYLNFFYWRVALSFYGNTFRTIYTCAMLFYLYRYFREDRIDFKYAVIIIGFAGIAFSSSFLFISFSIMYALMVYMFYTKNRNSIREMADFVLPILVYALACFYKDNLVLFIIGIISAPLYFLFRNRSFMIRITDVIEEFLHKYAIQIFVIGVTVLMVVGGFIYYQINPGYEYNYRHYFENHQSYDMIKDYFFIYTGKSQNLVNIMRWVGVILLFMIKTDDKGMKFFKYLFIVLFVVFLNPLCVIAISKMFASNVYYRTFDVIFNPLTEMLFIVLIITKWNKKWMYGLMIVFVAYMISYAHIASQINEYTGEYGYYLHRGVMPKYKMDYYNYDVIKAFEEDIRDKSFDRQIRIISHAEGLRTFEPDVHQLFTAREYYYPGDRINYEFYEQARNHYSWETYYETDFSSACKYIDRFDVDYVIVEWLQNWDFEIEISKCGELVYESEVYKIYGFVDNINN